MKLKKLKYLALIACLGAAPTVGFAEVTDFSGANVAFRLGMNRSDASGNGVNVSAQNNMYPGLSLGYGWQVDQLYVGLEGFADFHTRSTTDKDAGLDLKLGMINGNWLPYLKLGVIGTTPYRMHQGLGLEYKIKKNSSIDVEWTKDQSTLSGVERTNNNLSVGLHYYFK